VRSGIFIHLISLALNNQNKYRFSSLIKIIFIALTIANQIFSQTTNCILYNTSNSGLHVNWVLPRAFDELPRALARGLQNNKNKFRL
jgi:hypothetical protein